jgi:hypothetical protein
MDKNDIIMMLLIAMAISLTIELIYLLLRKKLKKEDVKMFRKPEQPVETLADKAHNTVLTAENISAALAKQGANTIEADSFIQNAKRKLAMKEYASAIEQADAAKLALLRVKRGLESRPRESTEQYPNPGARPMDRSVYDQPPDKASGEERSLESLPANYVQSKFMLNTTRDLIEKKGIKNGEAYDFYISASKAYEQQDYTKALSLAIKAERLLDSGTLSLIGEEKAPAESEEIILVCPGCDAEVTEADVFCGKCGQNLAAMECPGCGTELNSSDRFCRKCGYKLK